MNTFKLKVVASNKVFFDGDCQSLVIPVADEGLCGFLANHENTVAPIEFGEMKITDANGKVIEAFKSKLESNGINVTIRREMGRDIDGACGQLRRKYSRKQTITSTCIS